MVEIGLIFGDFFLFSKRLKHFLRFNDTKEISKDIYDVIYAIQTAFCDWKSPFEWDFGSMTEPGEPGKLCRSKVPFCVLSIKDVWILARQHWFVGHLKETL